MSIFKILAMIGKVADKTEKVSEEVLKLEGTDFSTLSKLEALEKLTPALNAFIDLAEIAANDDGDAKLEEIRKLLNDISKS